MTEINIEVQKTIRRPIGVVSRQFGDMQHHSRDRVHPDLKFTVISEQGNTCRFRQDVKILGMLQSDEIVQTRNADGTLLAEVVSGTNEGLRFHQSFAAIEGDATLVTFRVKAPVKGIKLLLKPLFQVAIRRAVEKGLEEDRMDLEERGYGAS